MREREEKTRKNPVRQVGKRDTAFAFLLTITHAGRQRSEATVIAISAPVLSPV